MDFLDDLPQRPETHDTADLAAAAFVDSIEQHLFIIQLTERCDYGTDFQLEARQGNSVTNLRVHVQLKGTNVAANVDGSVSVAVARTNLNYLLVQPHSLYVCYHVPTRRLLANYVNDIYREYEHRGEWHGQASVTIRLAAIFDAAFQRTLHQRTIATGRSIRDQRMEWTVTPPDKISEMAQTAIPLVEVPTEPEEATAVLFELYNTAHDTVISKSFSRFAAILDRLPGAMDLAFMAEINLGLNGLPFDAARVREGIQVIEKAMLRGDQYPGPLLYSQGNAWLALGEPEKARETYHRALLQLEGPRLRDVAAQCNKNMGSVLYRLGQIDAAKAFYERALTLDPDLAEAHFAIALWYGKHSDNYRAALMHLDSVTRRRGSSLSMQTVMGWRIELLFRVGDADGAFREIRNLIGVAAPLEWARPWCARQVLLFGRQSLDSTRKAVHFWRTFLLEDPSNHVAAKERLLCLLYLRAEGMASETSFEAFKREAIRLSKVLVSDAAFLWDRIGHWAQYDGNWLEAERHYRKAYELEQSQFGYCLGTALNFLDRYEEALPVLLRELERPEADALCWFQVAIAKERTGDTAGAIVAYRFALDLDANYALAWFNLGGVYWNSDDIGRATTTWREAMDRFPDHELTVKLQKEMAFLFSDGEKGNR